MIPLGSRTTARACALSERSPVLFTFQMSGRDGQIRTADLSLRRRPLYPSELRPRAATTILPTLEAFLPDVTAIVHAGEVNFLRFFIRVPDRLFKRGASRGNAQHAAAGCY